jgi:hypothetical protein
MAIDHEFGVKNKPFTGLRLASARTNAALRDIYKFVPQKGLQQKLVNELMSNVKGLKGQQLVEGLMTEGRELAEKVLVKGERYPLSAYRMLGGEFLKPSKFKTLTGPEQKVIKQMAQADTQKIFKAYQKAKIGGHCRAYGGRVGFKDAGAVGMSECMTKAIEEHNKNLKSDDLTIRNSARAKQFNINKTKNMKSLLGAGAKGGKSLLKLGRSWGIELEPIFEGAFYEWGRRQGYTHDQAKEETFFWKMLDPSTKTGLLEGAEPLLEKELYEIRGEDEFMDVDNRPPMQDPEFGQVIGERKSVKRYIDNEKALYEAQDKYNQLYNDYIGATTGPKPKERDPEKAEGYAKALEDTWAEMNRLEDQMDLDRDTYQAAVEKQQHIQGERALKYGEYGTGDTEKLAKQRERRRQREMEEKFPSYKKHYIDKALEHQGITLDPDIAKYKKDLQLVPGTYDEVSDYWKDYDKMKYYAENFRTEKAGGGLANLTRTVAPDSGPVSRGLRSLYIDDMD